MKSNSSNYLTLNEAGEPNTSTLLNPAEQNIAEGTNVTINANVHVGNVIIGKGAIINLDPNYSSFFGKVDIHPTAKIVINGKMIVNAPKINADNFSTESLPNNFQICEEYEASNLAPLFDDTPDVDLSGTG